MSSNRLIYDTCAYKAEIISEVRYSWDIYEWMSEVENEKKLEDDVIDMIIRVSIKKGLPTKSVNKIILSYHH